MTTAYKVTLPARSVENSAERLELAPSTRHREDLDRHMARFSRYCRSIADAVLVNKGAWLSAAQVADLLELEPWAATRLLAHTKQVWAPGQPFGNKFSPHRAVPLDAVTAKVSAFDRVTIKTLIGTRNVAVLIAPGASSLELPEGSLFLAKDNGEFSIIARR